MTVEAADRRLRRARRLTLASLATNLGATLLLPGVGLVREPDPVRSALGLVGLLAVVVAQAAVLHTAVTPWPADRRRRRARLGLAGAALASVPLVGPVAAGAWPTWAWLGAALVGLVPLLRPPAAVIAAVGVLAVSVAVTRLGGGAVRDALLVTGGVGAGAAAITWVQVWFWELLVQARQGQAARTRLAAAEERLRFARDVHDLLGHDLTVIALKAELAARLAPVDAARAGAEAAEVQRLAGSALHRVREAVHGYRAVDLAEQVAAVGEVLRSSGVRCTVVPPVGDLPPAVAADLAAVLREAGTNVLRHSRAGWCRIEIVRDDRRVTLTVRNDGVLDAAPDPYSGGLRGLADRLAPTGGSVRGHAEDGIFSLVATVPVPS
ncbi:sensor histidine kinase [Micromonospora auratinigra]|uniref:Two-component system, NarL family, sensor histidine kinase DesK n=1 Tax=Micromonospora auratinigra TaxID=261654 RepID=A0A1A8Z7Z1_9ACTN|nr:histidine kinase [Micromonospora auratinigra]SBT39903.1 two-component system, NarL family, sensor histidine kinase DesK [Micromonospora auratinigra]